MVFRPSRENRGSDRFLDAKLILFAIGAAIGLAGIISGLEIFVGIGILVLAIGALLRFVGRRD